MANISTWSTLASANNQSPPHGAPEGWPPGAVNDWARETMAAMRRWYEDAEWINLGHSPSYAGSSSFTISGDRSAIYHERRRLRIKVGAGTLYGTVSNVNYVAPTTTVTVALDQGAIDTSVSSVAVGIISAQNSSMGRRFDSPEISAGTASALWLNKPIINGGTASALVQFAPMLHGGTSSGHFLYAPIINAGTASALYLFDAIINGGTTSALVQYASTLHGGTLSAPTIFSPTISGGTASSILLLSPVINGGSMSGQSIWSPIMRGDWNAANASISGGVYVNPVVTGGTSSAQFLYHSTLSSASAANSTFTNCVYLGGTSSGMSIYSPVVIGGTASSMTLTNCNFFAVSISGGGCDVDTLRRGGEEVYSSYEKPMFHAHKEGNNQDQSSSGLASPVLVQFSGIEDEQGGYFTTATARWTPPRGRFFLHAQVTFAAAGIFSGDRIHAAIYKNGSAWKSAFVMVTGALDTAAGDVITVPVTGSGHTFGADYFQVYAAVEATTGIFRVEGATSRTFFLGHLL